MNQILLWKHLDKGDGSREYIISLSTDLWPTGLTESAKWSRNLAVKPDEKSTRQCFILRGRCSETGLVTVSPCRARAQKGYGPPLEIGKRKK